MLSVVLWWRSLYAHCPPPLISICSTTSGIFDKAQVRFESNLQQGAELGGGERDVLVAHHNLQLLAAHAVRHRPAIVVLLHQLRGRKNYSQYTVSAEQSSHTGPIYKTAPEVDICSQHYKGRPLTDAAMCWCQIHAHRQLNNATTLARGRV